MGAIAVDEAYVGFLKERRERLLERIALAAEAAGRDPTDVVLAAVSKTVDVDSVVAAKLAGYTTFAENRPQELERKLAALEEDGMREGTSWHMIGNLQTNKINHVLACSPDMIQSVSTLELARAIAKRAEASGVGVKALIEVNVSGEASKSGIAPGALLQTLDEWLGVSPAVEFVGLMTMAPAEDPAAADATFAGLRDLRDELSRKAGGGGLVELSMGMSGDFEAAVRRGATIVRLGRIVFDPGYALDD